MFIFKFYIFYCVWSLKFSIFEFDIVEIIDNMFIFKIVKFFFFNFKSRSRNIFVGSFFGFEKYYFDV